MSGHHALPYRPQIDGLRAIAVLAVVLYHFGLPGLPGGFVGVDVFFVISGYLIGGMLWAELRDTGRIALGAFYLRRIRRLAPAFFVMLAVAGVAGWFILLPFEFREFGKEAIAATVWLSNVLFFQGAGYFDAGAETKVLLHTWSLSVEEQFYLVLPLTLLVLSRFPRLSLPMLALAWGASLAACAWMTPANPTATFYLFPFRAWEMLTGVLLAILWRRAAHPLVPLTGLFLIFGAILIVPAGPTFPGWQALLPVAGAAMVLAGGPGPVARVLSLRPLVGIGLISYSLYLWHWPVLILSRYWRDGYDHAAESALWLVLSLGLAWASWAWVERPFRRPGAVGAPALMAGFACACAAALASGLWVWRGDGLAYRFSPDTQAHIAASGDFLQDWSRCGMATDGPFAGVETCAIGPDGPPQVVFWGDSHLRALMDGLALAASESATPGLIIWHAGCPPLFGLTKQESAATPAQDAACTAANRVMEQALTGPEAPGTLVWVGRWTYYAIGTGVGIDAANAITLSAAPPLSPAPQAELYAAAWTLTVDRLAPHIPRLFILRQPSELPDYDSRSVARGLAHGRLTTDQAAARMRATPDPARIGPAELPIDALVAAGGVSLIDPFARICTPECRADHDDTIWYFDNNHLTNAGARALRDLFASVFAGAGP